MSSFVIKNSRVVGLDTVYDGLSVLCIDGKIAKISRDNIKCENVIDALGGYLSPGFIDLHIHGILGCSVDDGVDCFSKITKNLPRFGVTGYLPTFAPRKAGEDAAYLKSIANAKVSGAEVLGFHLEGPFLSITGALPAEAIGTADKQRVRNLINAAQPFNAIFSISPEFEGIDRLLPVMTENGSPVFITHTSADTYQTLKAINLGACHATHFYDVFYSPPEKDLGVRPCGAVEAILASSMVSVDFILDGEHVDPVAVKMALNCKGFDKVCLISDASPGAGAEPGVHNFVGGKVEIKYKGGPARDIEKGHLAGSGLTMDLAVTNAINMLGINLCQAVRMASANPAKVLGLENSKGQIKEGFDADIVLLDNNLQVVTTWNKGIITYNRENEGKI